MEALLKMNLQFFAKDGPGGEKTEEPTAKKRQDTRKEGKVAKSQELSHAVSLIALFLVLKFGTGFLGRNFLETFTMIYNRIPDLIVLWGGQISTMEYATLLRVVMLRILVMLAPFFICGFVVAIGVNLWQVKWAPTTKPLKPKLSKLDPIKGMSKLFSKQKLVDLLLSVAKIVVIIYVSYSVIKDQIGMILLMLDMPALQAVQAVGTLIIDVGLRISIVFLIVGFGDYAYQKWKHHEDIKMTKQEVKDEMKNTEGDPQIKGKQKQRMMEASRRRMMQNIPQADVVITNPTHFAVCLKYDTNVASAPIVTAKGADFLAQKIKDIAKENNVEIVENKPLARMLYHNVELGGLVPPELYQAVAEVLAFVYNLKNKAS